jgi:hypothetical protein
VGFAERGLAFAGMLGNTPSRHLPVSYHWGYPSPGLLGSTGYKRDRSKIFDEKGLIGKIFIPMDLQRETSLIGSGLVCVSGEILASPGSVSG